MNYLQRYERQLEMQEAAEQSLQPINFYSIEKVRRSPRQLKRHLARRALHLLITYFLTRFNRTNLQKGVSNDGTTV